MVKVNLLTLSSSSRRLKETVVSRPTITSATEDLRLKVCRCEVLNKIPWSWSCHHRSSSAVSSLSVRASPSPTWCRVKGSGFRVEGGGFGVQGLGFGVSGLGVGVSGLGVGV